MSASVSTPRSVLVTGGLSGLGRAISECLSAAGWKVFAASRQATLPEGMDESIRALCCDVTEEEQVESAVAQVIRTSGRLDAIVCNAGMNVSAVAEELPINRARAILDTNLWGPIYGTRAVLPHFRKNRKGIILVIGSLAGVVSPPGEAYYAASKHGIRGFLESVQYEVSGVGIRVHLIEPGFIRTNLAKSSEKTNLRFPEYNKIRDKLALHWRIAINSG